MLHVRYVHLTKVKSIINNKPFLSSETMLNRGYARNGSVAKWNLRSPVSRHWRQDELIGGNTASNSWRPVVRWKPAANNVSRRAEEFILLETVA
jgi:hypothetical protein